MYNDNLEKYMCGIAGFINTNYCSKNQILFEKMVDIVSHRGPDGRGIYSFENVLLGHRELSIIDNSVYGKQPMEYNDRYVISFNGEIYNYIELKEELTRFGYLFKTKTDTEIIMAAYDYWGLSCLEKFIGMWAFIILDKRNRKLIASRDRFGIKPLYYTYIGSNLAFASEIKQFTVFPEWKSKANNKRLLDYLMSGVTDHTNETLFQNVFQLRGGEFLEYDIQKQISLIKTWYDLKLKNKPFRGSFEKAQKQFQFLFSDSIKLQMRSDVKVGSALSGGLDSSSIVCLLNEQLKELNHEFKQEVVSSCSIDSKYDEQKFIDLILLDRNIQGYKVFPNSNNLLSNLDRLVWFQDEPFISTSMYAQFEVFKKARENNLIVMLDGQGADEQLAGYTGFFYKYLLDLLLKLKWISLVKNLIGSKKFYGIPIHKNIFLIFKTAIVSITPDFFINFIRLFKGKVLKTRNRYTSLFNSKFIKDSQYKTINLKGSSLYSESIISLNFTSLPKLLHYEDRNSMANSVESRVPFLDHRLVEFVLNLPDDFKINKSIRKFILRESMKNFIPEKIYSRYDKMSFLTSEEVWIRNNQKLFRKEIELACNKLNGILDKNETLSWFDEILKSQKSFDYLFWKIINVGRWIKVFNVEISNSK